MLCVWSPQTRRISGVRLLARGVVHPILPSLKRSLSIVASGLLIASPVNFGEALGQTPVQTPGQTSGQTSGQTEAAQPAPDLRTVAETSGFRRTATHAQTVALLDAIAAAHPTLSRRASMGSTEEGRDQPLLILSDPAVGTPKEAKALCDRTGRVLVFVFANIHAGEVDGKEALPILARELLEAPDEPLLDQLVIVMAPIYNADGNERFAPNDVNRKGQNGPEEMGIRENSNGLDLNRDFIKMEAVETRNLVAAVNAWDAQVVVDCHVTNGSYHRFLVTYAGPKSPAGDARVVEFSDNVFLPDIDRRFEAATGEHAFWYGSFEGSWGEKPASRTRWETFPAQGRYGTTYFGMCGRLSVLVESYSYAPFKDRVLGTRDFCRAILQSAAAHAGPIRGLRDGAIRHGVELSRDGIVGIRSRDIPNPEKGTILGYTEEAKSGQSALETDHAEYECEILHRVEAELTVRAPVAYAIPAAFSGAIAVLDFHGVRRFTLNREQAAEVERSTIDTIAPASRLFQGHAVLQLTATAVPASVTLPAGTTIVPLDHERSGLVVYLLEAASEDGLAAWNFFDEGLKVGAPFPVLRVLSPSAGWETD